MVFKDIRLALERIERRQRLILERLKAVENAAADQTNKWIESGIDNILGYQAGKKKEE